MLTITKSMIEKISKIMDLDKKEKEILSKYFKIQKANLKIKKHSYKAFRIIHNNSLGPGKGGIRYHPNVSEDEVKSLSFWMSLKNSLAGLPFGGAKGGIIVDPKKLSQDELQELSRKYVRAFHKHMGQDKDVPAPDVYTNPQIMSWMLDEFEKINDKKEPGFITGKPVELGGIRLRNDSTSKGGFIIFNELAKKENIKNSRIAIQGFGNAGYFMAKHLSKNIVAVSDSSGGIYDPKGLNIDKAKNIKDEKGSVQNYSAKKISNKELLELDIDILVLAALENQITKENASRIKAGYIIELANGPISNDADGILFKKKITVIPDILANSGGVVGSYFEWLQNKTGTGFEDSYIERMFDQKMKETFNKVYNEYKNSKHDMRTAAYVIAIRRILDAERLRGRI